MPSRTDRTTGEIDWPAGWDRTAARRRRKKRSFDTGLRDTIDELEQELESGLDVDDWRLDTAAQHQKRNPKYPYANAAPDDPGAVVRWSKDGEQFAVACDRWSRLRDNVREGLKYIQDKRRMSNRPVQTGRDEFANARLPPGDEEGGAAIVATSRPPHEVLGVEPDADEDRIVQAYRDRIKEAHADQGDREDLSVQEVKEAKEAMLG